MSGFVGLFCWFVFAGDGDAMHDSETNLVWRQLSVGWGLVTHGQVVSDDEVSGLVMMMILKCSILLHKFLLDTLQNIFSVLSRHQLFWRFLVVQDESLCHAKMKTQDWLPWLRVIVDERMHWTCPPVRHHPQPVPELSLIISQLLNDVGERSKDSGTLAGNTDDVVEGVGEGTLYYHQCASQSCQHWCIPLSCHWRLWRCHDEETSHGCRMLTQSLRTSDQQPGAPREWCSPDVWTLRVSDLSHLSWSSQLCQNTGESVTAALQSLHSLVWSVSRCRVVTSW